MNAAIIVSVHDDSIGSNMIAPARIETTFPQFAAIRGQSDNHVFAFPRRSQKRDGVMLPRFTGKTTGIYQVQSRHFVDAALHIQRFIRNIKPDAGIFRSDMMTIRPGIPQAASNEQVIFADVCHKYQPAPI